MASRWNLDNLYTSLDSPNIKTDIQKSEELLKQATDFVNIRFKDTSDADEKILTYFELIDELDSLTSTLGTYASLIYSVDTNNINALKLLDKLESLNPDITLLKVKFRRWLKDLDNIDVIIKDNNDLKKYSFLIRHEKEKSQYLLSDEEESLLAELINTGSNSWSKLQDLVTSSLKIEYEDKVLPLSIIRSMAYDKDVAVRERAYDAELKAYDKISKTSASALNAIKGEVITVAKRRGYSSPLEMTLSDSRMDQPTLDALLSAIKEYLPIFHSYLKKKANLLGYDGGLPFYDLFAPIGNVNMSFSYEEAITFIVEHFNSFSKNLGDFALNAFNSNWIDSEPRDGKVSGAFCSNIHRIKESRIMSNFSGNFNDVSTLAHELGHGYHGHCLNDVVYSNSNYPMPLAETASIFCETIITKAALQKASADESITILESSIMNATQVIVDIYSRYLFETRLFELRKESSLSVDELKDLMINAQKEAYGDGLDYKFLHPYMWVCKPHYYYSDSNFYNYPYAFGLLFAKGLYSKYEELGSEFIPKYDTMLKATGSNNIKDVLKTMDVDAHSVDFFKSSLEQIKKDIDKFLSY